MYEWRLLQGSRRLSADLQQLLRAARRQPSTDLSREHIPVSEVAQQVAAKPRTEFNPQGPCDGRKPTPESRPLASTHRLWHKYTHTNTHRETETPTQKERENNVTKYLIQLGSGGTHQAKLVYRMSSWQPGIHSNSLSKKY